MTPTARAAVVVLALLAAACGDAAAPDGASPGVGPPTTAAGPAGSSVASPTGAPSTAPVAPPPGSPETEGDGGNGDGGNGDGSVTAGPGPDTGPPATLDGRVDVGAFASALLRPDAATRLVLDVQADVAPRGDTLDHLQAVLARESGKPVDVVAGAAPGGGDRAWDADALRAAADAGASAPEPGTAVVHLLFVHGTLDGDESILGVAVRGDVAALFVDRIDAAAGLLGNAGAIERSTSTHELGHLLGLVDLHLATGRGDPEHPGHSTNPGSVMYWAVESDLVGQLLGARPPDDFDADDEADLAAIRAGG